MLNADTAARAHANGSARLSAPSPDEQRRRQVERCDGPQDYETASIHGGGFGGRDVPDGFERTSLGARGDKWGLSSYRAFALRELRAGRGVDGLSRADTRAKLEKLGELEPDREAASA